MKKGIKLIILAIVSLCICWFAGQQMKTARLARQEKPMNPESGEWSLLEHMDSDRVIVEGRTESSDYPYGYNVGAIEDEQVGAAIFLTPDTSIKVEGAVSEGASLNMEFFLHPWVADGSDGALLNVAVTADGTTSDYVYEVSTDSQKQTLTLGETSGNVQIEFAVSNKEGRNTDCDWVVLTQCSFLDDNFKSN